MLDSQKYYFFVGTYTSMSWCLGNKGEGIYLAEFDPRHGSMSCLSVVSNVENPSFMAFDSSFSYLYVINEIEPVSDDAIGKVSTFKVDRQTGSLTLAGTASSSGLSPCYIIVDKNDKYAYITNYSSGSLVSFPIEDDHTIGDHVQIIKHSGHGINKERQESAHTHSVILDKNQKHVLVADLGIDKIMVYKLINDKSQQQMSFAASANVNPGDGPRHMTFDASGKYLYVICELGSKIHVFDYDGDTGSLEKIQEVSTLSPGTDIVNHCADIHISEDGNHLFGSNRGHNSIAVFRRNPQTGLLTFIYAQPTYGRTPRNFSLDPSGRFIIVANQDSNNLVSFSIDNESGRLNKMSELEIPSPVFIKFLEKI